MTEQDIHKLLEKYHTGACTPEELAFIHSWYNDLESRLSAPDRIADWGAIHQELWGRMKAVQQIPAKRVSIFYRYRVAVAAAVVLVIAGAGYFVLQSGHRKNVGVVVQVEDAPAGSNRATLTLANGQQIVLDAARTGTLAQQAGVTVSKNANGQLVYVISPSLPPASLPEGERNSGTAFNTITTPNGGQYEVYLPDGSHVYLNAASSLKYPVKFTGNTRTVILKGEAYFEVKKNINQSFIVSSYGQSVKVLGTHFNVSSYADEPVITTLAEGKIELSSSSFPQKTILQPGNQSTALPDRFKVDRVNIDEIAAWKDGLFKFNKTELKDALRQMARWYDVSVDSAIPAVKISGEIPRKANLLKVLAQIEAVSDVKLKLQERRIMLK